MRYLKFLLRYLGFLLHAYQPPTQPQWMINKIFRESYEPVIRMLEKHPSWAISLDLAKSLGERLPKEFLERIRTLYFKQQVEIVNTAAYHYLLPLVPDNVVRRQLKLNAEFYKEHITAGEPIPGIFPPELAFKHSLASLVASQNYSWILIDDELMNARRTFMPEKERVPQTRIPSLYGCGLIPRSRLWSDKIANKEYQRGDIFARNLIAGLESWREQCHITREDSKYAVIALDFETFGHHHEHAIEDFLIPFFEEMDKHADEIQISQLSYIFHAHPKTIIYDHDLYCGSWATSAGDLIRGIPYPLWDHPENEFHRAWNEFMKVVFDAIPGNPTTELQELLDKAFYSCTPWQYSHGNKDVASWCLPMFEKIIKLLPEIPQKMELAALYGKMDNLTKIIK